MVRLTSSILYLCTLLFSETPFAETLKCDIGPLNKSYGGTPWLVYSCNDEQTLVFVSERGSPASPF